jgi:hypothetical protein
MKHITGQSNTTLNDVFTGEDDKCACVSFICTMLTANWMELQRLKKHDTHTAINVAKQLATQNTSIVEDEDLWSHKMPTA